MNKKHLLIALAIILTPIFVFAQFTVPQGGTGRTTYPNGALFYFDGTRITATSSQPLYVGSIVATSTLLVSSFPYASSTIYSSFQTASTTQLHIGTGQGYAFVGSLGRVGVISSSTLATNLQLNCATITGGAGLCDGTDADTTYTAGDALTLTGNDIDFDGGTSPGGSLGGTWASPTIDDLFILNTGDVGTGSYTFPYASSTGFSSSYASSTDLRAGFLRISGLSDGCLSIASGLVTSAGIACGSGGGGSDPFTHSTIFLPTSATTTKIGIGTSTPYYSLTVASSTGPQFALSDGAGIAQWTMRNANGNLYFATTTVAGTATTSTSAMTLNLTGRGLSIGSTTPIALFSISSLPGETIMAIGSSTGQYMTIDSFGRMSFGGHNSVASGPTLSSCGTGPALYEGNDMNGIITVGTGSVTSCTLTFGATFPPYSQTATSTPVCMAIMATTSSKTLAASTTATTLVITSNATIASHRIVYQCFGNLR